MSRRASPIRFSLALVLVAWAAAVAAVGIAGDFPLSDDWVYAHVVRALLAGRGFDFLPWTGASFVAQAVYGAAVASVAGPSYAVLRASTLLLATGGLAAFYALLREVGADKPAAAAGTAVLAFSPLWFNLAFTFMTDVPFAATALVACWAYARALGRPSRGGLFAAGALDAVAFLVRQHALSIAVAAALASLLPSREPERTGVPLSARIADAAAALALPVAVAAAWALWAVASASAPLAVHNKISEAAGATLLPVANVAFRGAATVGFLYVPWLVAAGRPRGRELALFAGCLAALAAAAAFSYAHDGAAMFYLSNVLGDRTLGPVTTRDVFFLAKPFEPDGGALFHFLLTALSLVSAAALAARLSSAAAGLAGRGTFALPAGANRRAALFCALALALSAAGTLAQAHYYFDRYLIVLLPLAIAAVVPWSPSPRTGAAFAAVLAAFAYYSVAGTHDYMAWNRARWDLLASLEARGVSPAAIDGGVEYDAARFAAETRTSPTDAQVRRGQDPSVKSWWWVKDDEWVIAFGVLDGYAEADSRSFARWLPPGEGRILALRRQSPARPPASPMPEDAR